LEARQGVKIDDLGNDEMLNFVVCRK